MTVVQYTLSEEGAAVFHDALACIAKFSEDVCLEVRRDLLTLTALNLSKSAYIRFTFAAKRFFLQYKFEGKAESHERFSCVLYVRALILVFRARQGGDSSRDRDKDTTIDHCDVRIEDGPTTKSRLIAQISCRNGITASHALPFEAKAPTHAKFVEQEAIHHWAISSRTLRQLMDHFGPGIELLDINTDASSRVVNFACFTDKVARTSTSSEGVLKKPLHTSIAVDMDEFDDIDVEDKLHIIISVRDFRAILQHAQLTSGELSSSYSRPGKPMKLSYHSDGISSDFILMTVSDKDASAGQKNRGPQPKRAKSARPGLESASVSNQNSPAVAVRSIDKPAPSEAPPQSRNAASRASIVSRPRQPQFKMRPSPAPPRPATAESESLFVTQNEDDQLWEPVNPDAEEDEDADNARLEWDHNAQNSSTMRISDPNKTQRGDQGQALSPLRLPAGMEPTQRLSQVRRFGLFSP